MKKWENNILQDTNAIYMENIDFIEKVIQKQIEIDKDLQKFGTTLSFTPYRKELTELVKEFNEVKQELKILNEKNDITPSSLLKKSVQNQYMNIGNKIIELNDKTANSLTNLYASIKNMFTDHLTTADKNIIKAKVKMVKTLSNSMADFLKTQTKKLENCINKLESLSKDIEKNEKKTTAKIKASTANKKSVLKSLDENKKKIFKKPKNKTKTVTKNKSVELR